MRFEEQFWLGNDIQTPISTINAKVAQGHVEHQEVLQLIGDISQLHSAYASQLNQLINRVPSSLLPISTSNSNLLSGNMNKDSSSNEWFAGNGFGRDEGGQLKLAFNNTKIQLQQLAQTHELFSSNLKMQVCESMSVWLSESRKIWKQKSKDLDVVVKQLERSRADCNKKHDQYRRQFIQVQDLKRQLTVHDREDESSMQVVVQLGTKAMSRHELLQLLDTMKAELTTKETTHMFSKYQSVTGLQLLQFIKDQNVVDSQDDGVMFLQALLDQGHLRLLGRGKTFIDQGSYVWLKSDEELLRHKLHDSNQELLKTTESYKHAVDDVEIARMQFEVLYQSHLNFTANMEVSRMANIKIALHNLGNQSSALCVQMQNSFNSVLVGLESVEADKDLQKICQLYSTGMIRPQPVVLQSLDVDVVSHTLFGVTLSDHCKYFNCSVPWIVSSTMKFIRENFQGKQSSECLGLLLQALDVTVSDLNLARTLLNKTETIGLDTLNLPIVVAILRRYLMELPEPLVDVDGINELSNDAIMTVLFDLDEHKLNVLRDLLSLLAEVTERKFNSSTMELLEMWSPVIVRQQDCTYLTNASKAIAVLELLIDNHASFFGDGYNNSGGGEPLSSAVIQLSVEERPLKNQPTDIPLAQKNAGDMADMDSVALNSPPESTDKSVDPMSDEDQFYETDVDADQSAANEQSSVADTNTN